MEQTNIQDNLKSTYENFQFKYLSSREQIVERLLQAGQITCAEAIILLKDTTVINQNPVPYIPYTPFPPYTPWYTTISY